MRILSKACRQVSVPSERRRIVNSDWDVVPHQRNQELSSPEFNGGAVIFRVKRCSHYEEMFEMLTRYLISIVDTCTPRTLLTRDINIEVPPELY